MTSKNNDARELVAESTEDECDRCGEYAAGRYKTMFYNWGTIARLRGLPVAREFFCHRCLRIMRIQSAIGLTILGLLIVGMIGGTIWVLKGP